jgi:hypothetical protein
MSCVFCGEKRKKGLGNWVRCEHCGVEHLEYSMFAGMYFRNEGRWRLVPTGYLLVIEQWTEEIK